MAPIDRPRPRSSRAHRPWVLAALRLERARARAGEDVRDAHLVQIGANGDRVLRADRVEDREDAVLLDEPAGLVDGASDVESVVDVLVADLPEDASAVVDVAEVGVGAGRDRAKAAAGPVSRTVPPRRIELPVTPGSAAEPAWAPGSATSAAKARTTSAALNARPAGGEREDDPCLADGEPRRPPGLQGKEVARALRGGDASQGQTEPRAARIVVAWLSRRMVRFRVVERSVVVGTPPWLTTISSRARRAEPRARRRVRPAGRRRRLHGHERMAEGLVEAARRRHGPDDLADPVDRPPAAEPEPENPPGRDLRRLVGARTPGSGASSIRGRLSIPFSWPLRNRSNHIRIWPK